MLYTPTGSTRRRLPLIVMLHGCGQTARDFASGTGFNALADEFGFLVLYPEQSLSANFAKCWNWHRPGDQRRGAGEPAAIAALTRQIIASSKANASRVYVAGLSAGGAAASILAGAYPDLFTALGIHSGVTHGNVRNLSAALAVMRTGNGGATATARSTPPPTIIFHGDADTVVHPANAGTFIDSLRSSKRRPLGVTVQNGKAKGGRTYTRTTYRLQKGAVWLEDWTIHGGGHAWAGGNCAGSYTDPLGPDASRAMVLFFLARRKPTAATPGLS